MNTTRVTVPMRRAVDEVFAVATKPANFPLAQRQIETNLGNVKRLLETPSQ